MRGDGEHRVGDALVPRDARRPRHVGTAVDVPEPAPVLVVVGRLPPSRVRNDVAVLTEEGLDAAQDLAVGDRPLHGGAPIEHLVAEGLPVFGWIARLACVGRVLLVDALDLAGQRLHRFRGEDLLEDDVPLGLEVLGGGAARARAPQRQVTGLTGEHVVDSASVSSGAHCVGWRTRLHGVLQCFSPAAGTPP